MASDTSSSLISMLETSNYTNLRQNFTEYLIPFSPFINYDFDSTKKKKKTQKATKKEKIDTSTLDQNLIRPLAKQFLPFITSALKLLPNRLTELHKSSESSEEKKEEIYLDLFDVYKLCLECLACISCCLTCKFFYIHSQRVRLIRCYELLGRYLEAEIEGFLILKSLIAGNLPKRKKIDVKVLPDLVGENVDPELASLIVELVVYLVKCSYKSQRKEDAVYQRVLSMIDQVRPWLSVLNPKEFERLQPVLVNDIYRCTLFMLGKDVSLDGDLVHRFCMITMTEFSKSSNKHNFFKVARNICSSLSSQWNSRSPLILDILKFMVEYITPNCEVGLEDNVNDCFDIVHNCLRNCRLASTDLRRDVGKCLENMATGIKVLIPIDSILRLYASGLCLMEANFQTRCIKSENSVADMLIELSICTGDLQYLADALCSLATYFHGGSVRGKSQHGRVSFMSYLNALAFFCHPAAELLNRGSKVVNAEKNSATVSPNTIYIMEAFQQLCDAFLLHFSSDFEKEIEKFNESSNTLLYVAKAALSISLIMDNNVERSVYHIDSIISSQWIRLKEMTFLIASIYNIGVELYNAKQFNQASVVFELCCRSAWTRVSLACNRYAGKSEVIHDDCSEKAITGFVKEACSKGAILLDALHQCGKEMHSTMVSTLVNWSVAANLFESLDGPTLLVRNWAKIICKVHKEANTVDNVPLLYSLLCGSSTELNKRTIGIILEQELLIYEELEAHNKNLCRGIQLKIIDILLRNVYDVTGDYVLPKSMVLIKQGRIYRVSGINGLKSCIQCLSEAISILISVPGEASTDTYAIYYQLALAYSLRALCLHEAQSNLEAIFPENLSTEKGIIDDIQCALTQWSSIDWSVKDHYKLVNENAVQLLGCIADLLSNKGYFHLQCDIYKLMIIFLRSKGVELEKCFAMLWADRMLNHALCTTPIDEEIVLGFAQHFDVCSDTVDFWENCIKDSQPLLVGFRQQFYPYRSSLTQDGHCQAGRLFCSGVTVDEVKEVASALLSSVPTPRSTFLVGYLYYDLCERLISCGQPIEALSFAREAFRLRTKLLQKKFLCSFGKQYQNTKNSGETNQQNECADAELVVFGSVATEVWPRRGSWDISELNPSQWNVLKCYLESILQVGTIHEVLGNASVAEALFMQGKSRSSMQGLPIFEVTFASALGEVYCKKQLWDLAENELKRAKQILVDSGTSISCKRCKSTLEVTIDHRIGDLIRNCPVESRRASMLNSFSAPQDLYCAALNRLDVLEWRVSFSFTEERCQLANKALLNQNVDTVGSHLIMESKKSKNAPVHLPKERKLKQPNPRATRSRNRSTHNKSVEVRIVEEPECSGHSSGNGVITCPSSHSCSRRQSELNMPSTVEGGCTENCWKCLLVKVMENGKMQDLIHLKWELQRRRLSLRLLNEIGKCFGDCGEVSEMHQKLWQSISMLFNRPYSGPHSLLLETTVKESQGDLFAVERASVLYNLSWFCVKNIHSGIACCDLSRVQLSSVVSWLFQAFMLSREIPLLFQKVSRLLATVYLLSTSGEPFSSLQYPSEALSGSQWTAFFHQASLGTYFNHQLCADPSFLKLFNSVDSGGSHTASTETLAEVCNLLRLVPGKLDDLEKFVIEFYQLLPSITIICISSLDSDYANLLRNVRPGHFSSPGLTLLSRLYSDNEPVVVLLPSDVIPEVLDDETNFSTVNAISSKKWLCPWGCTVVNKVAPQFKLILEENYLSSSFSPANDTQEDRKQWWAWRRKLNDRLDSFVRGIEESWFGPWKCLLLGKPLDSTWTESAVLNMASALKHNFGFDANENLLRVILGGATSVAEIEECISQLLLHRGCLTRGGFYPHQKSELSITACSQAQTLSGKLFHQVIAEEISELEIGCINREAIILVLDTDVQMLPWENLPVLRKNEVYRMPSVGSISALIRANIHRQEQTGRTDETFPSIDPLDAFYLLNPSGDLDFTQIAFEEWFRDQKLEGKAGTPPSMEELVLALRDHDLFLYFGHGSGTQYIPGREIQKLENCAATLLMGCSSGCLPFMGCYNPQGAVLSYLLAGSPAIIANLWEVTDKDIDRFGKSMFNAWLQERSTSTNDCNPVNLMEEFESMSIERSEKHITRKKSRARNLRNDTKSSRCKDTRGHRPRIGSFMGQAREACTLPFLIGASPVCYGVPTGIRRKEKSS